MSTSCQTQVYCTTDAAPTKELPLITVGIVVLNRQWILKSMLDSLQSQTYPHNKLHIILIDGGSKDNTVKIAQDFLQTSDFYGYNILVQRCSIPEGRNLCIQKMKGDFLLFWDSDVVMDKESIMHQMQALNKAKADIVTSSIAEVYIASCEEIEKKWLLWTNTYFQNQDVHQVKNCTMGNTLISKKVLSQINFDNDLTYGEDMAFSFRARDLGYQILSVGNAYGFDINNHKEAFSDHSFDMPLAWTLRGIRKKGVIEAVTLFAESSNIKKDIVSFFVKRKRYTFYLAYIPLSILALAGFLLQNVFLASILPLYIVGYSALQVTKRGLHRGLKAVIRSILVGVPTTVLLLYYSMKLMTNQPMAYKGHYSAQRTQINPALNFAGGLSPDVT